MESPSPTPAPVTLKTSEPSEKNKIATSSTAPPVDESLRVSLSKIEYLVNAVGEMVILQS